MSAIQSFKKSWMLGACSVSVLVLGMMAFEAPLRAEPTGGEMRALYNRLETIERDLIDVQRQTYQAGSQAGGVASSGFGPDPASAADLSLRLQAVEDSLRGLTGQLEKISYDLSQTQVRLNQFAEDTEFRFQELGGAPGQASGAASASAPVGLTPPPDRGAGTLASSSGVLGAIPMTPQRDDGSTQSYESAPSPYPSAGGGAASSGTDLNPEDAYDAAMNQLKRGQFDAAEADLSNFLQRYPTHNLAGNAQYWLGETYYVRGAYRQAAEAFLVGYTTYSGSSKAPDSLLKLGMTLSALGQRDQACATLGQLRQQFPSASQAVTQRAEMERGKAGC
ncbi:MAG: tol-pal system protein YbgF [Parvibaculum sp.]